MAIYRLHKAFSDVTIALDYAGDLAPLNSAILAGLAAESPTGGPLTVWCRTAVLGDRRASRDACIAALQETPLAPGDPNPFWRAIESEQRHSGNRIQIQGDVASLEVLDPYWQSLDNVALALQVEHGDVDDLPQIWFEVDAANITDPVPDILTGATYLDEEEVEQARTWENWCDQYHTNQGPWDGKYYVPGNGRGDANPSAEVQYALYISPPDGVRIISINEMREIVARNQPEFL